MNGIVCFGTHILDTVARPVSTIPTAQNSIRIEQIVHAPGGPAAGVAVDVAHLGFDVASVGVVGNDSTGTFLTSMMADKGVDTSSVRVLEGAQTSSSILLVDQAGDRPALHVRGVNAIVQWDDLDLETLESAKIVHFGGFDALGALDHQTSLETMNNLRSSGITITMDFQSSAAHLREHLLELVGEVDVFLPNDEQAMGLTKTASVDEAGAKLIELGAGRVIITCGEEGMYYFDQQGTSLHQPAIETNVVDTTGCGDSVVASFIAAEVEGFTTAEQLLIAAHAGAAVASGTGSLGNLPTWSELLRRAGVTTTPSE